MGSRPNTRGKNKRPKPEDGYDPSAEILRCSVCGKDSEASSNMEDFYELELNIKGLNNLDESLDDYLSVEELCGENQYFCQSCGTRVDATRSIKLRSLPSVLNFQLKRYVFLPKTTTKKKISSSFSFPRQLNMTNRISNPSESDLCYELSAILIHKGTAVNSGHYVAHIKDVKSGQWWEFDDEHVSKLGCHPFGEISSKPSAKSEKIAHLESSEKIESVANGNHIESNHIASSDTNIFNHEEIFSSTDAYMLMYSCITANESDKSANENGDKSSRTSVMDLMDIDVKSSSLPFHLSEEIKELNTSYSNACEEYQLRKDREEAHITERRQEVKSVLPEAPVHSLEDPYYWISTDWLRQWADSISPPSIDNIPIQCLHGKVPPSKVTSMKRISSTAWQKLQSKYEGGPALTNKDYCVDCLKDGAKSAVSADDYQGRKASLRQLAEAALAGNCSDGSSYYVSRAWLSQWLRKKKTDVSSVADAGPTSSLRCPHGDLLPESAAAKRVLVPESLWLFLYENFISVRPDEFLGSLIFPYGSKACEVCSKELSEVACFQNGLRAAQLQQRQNHEKLITGKSFSLHPDCKYYLLPSSWLAKWRGFVTYTGKNLSSLAEPENLNVIMSSLFCKHSRLLERPLELVCKRGAITQKLSCTEGLTLVPESDWNLFCEEWNIPDKTSIRAEVAFANCTATKFAGSCEEIPISEEDLNPPNDEANYELEAKKPYIRSHPEICEDCIGERESCELIQKLNYHDENICVHLVRGKEAPRSIKEATSAVSESERRTSRRSRKTSFGNSINLKVSGTTSVYQLKMMLWEAFGVVRENQKLHKKSTEIEGDTETLADKNILPGDVLWVTDSEVYENRDIADELSEPKIEQQQAEEGFRGTLLTSDLSEW